MKRLFKRIDKFKEEIVGQLKTIDVTTGTILNMYIFQFIFNFCFAGSVLGLLIRILMILE